MGYTIMKYCILNRGRELCEANLGQRLYIVLLVSPDGKNLKLLLKK